MSRESDEWAHDKALGLMDATGEEYKKATGSGNAREAMRANKGKAKAGNLKESKAWAWWDEGDKQFKFVYPCEEAVRMCSGDYFKHDEKAGKGKVMPVIVTEAR